MHLPLILKPRGKGKLSKRDGDDLGFPVFPLEWEKNKGFKESDNLKLDIQSFVKKKLSAHEYPREVEVVKKLPVTSTGKILRRNLR